MWVITSAFACPHDEACGGWQPMHSNRWRYAQCFWCPADALLAAAAAGRDNTKEAAVYCKVLITGWPWTWHTCTCWDETWITFSHFFLQVSNYINFKNAFSKPDHFFHQIKCLHTASNNLFLLDTFRLLSCSGFCIIIWLLQHFVCKGPLQKLHKNAQLRMILFKRFSFLQCFGGDQYCIIMWAVISNFMTFLVTD